MKKEMTEIMRKITKETNVGLATLNTTPPDMQLFYMYYSNGSKGMAQRSQICLFPDSSFAVVTGGLYNNRKSIYEDRLITSIALSTAFVMGTHYNYVFHILSQYLTGL